MQARGMRLWNDGENNTESAVERASRDARRHIRTAFQWRRQPLAAAATHEWHNGIANGKDGTTHHAATCSFRCKANANLILDDLVQAPRPVRDHCIILFGILILTPDSVDLCSLQLQHEIALETRNKKAARAVMGGTAEQDGVSASGAVGATVHADAVHAKLWHGRALPCQ